MVSLGGSNVNRNQSRLAVLALAALIVAPVSAIVNFNHNVNVAEGSPIPPVPPGLVAEGSPIPPVPPGLVAEGSPIPPVPPTLVAEGSPIPPVPPVLVAEGSPIPPVPPAAAFFA
jgi:hypothetical protein